MNGEYDLQRFVNAQESGYSIALEEIRSGRKRSHWMWYIFPQLAELGSSYYAKYYGIEDLAHAKAYLKHPLLGPRLREICAALMALGERDPLTVMGYPDNVKLRSCMTLFDRAEPDAIFRAVLDGFYGGTEDELTVALLNKK